MPNGTKVVEMKTRVGVAGEQTYREALKNISRELRVQKVEMDAVTSAYGANQNSIEALSAKQQAKQAIRWTNWATALMMRRARIRRSCQSWQEQRKRWATLS